KDIGQVSLCPLWQLQALSTVHFLIVIIPSPGILACTEQKVQKRAKRKQGVGQAEVLQILDRGACSEGLEAAEDVEAQSAGQRQEHDSCNIYKDSLPPGPAKIHGKGDDIFKDRNDCGQGGKCQ